MILAHYPLTDGLYWWLWQISWGVNPYFLSSNCSIVMYHYHRPYRSHFRGKKRVKNTKVSPQNSVNDKQPWNRWPRLHYKRFLEKKQNTEKKHCWVRFSRPQDVNPSWLSLDFSHKFIKKMWRVMRWINLRASVPGRVGVPTLIHSILQCCSAAMKEFPPS